MKSCDHQSRYLTKYHMGVHPSKWYDTHTRLGLVTQCLVDNLTEITLSGIYTRYMFAGIIAAVSQDKGIKGLLQKYTEIAHPFKHNDSIKHHANHHLRTIGKLCTKRIETSQLHHLLIEIISNINFNELFPAPPWIQRFPYIHKPQRLIFALLTETDKYITR